MTIPPSGVMLPGAGTLAGVRCRAPSRLTSCARYTRRAHRCHHKHYRITNLRIEIEEGAARCGGCAPGRASARCTPDSLLCRRNAGICCKTIENIDVRAWANVMLNTHPRTVSLGGGSGHTTALKRCCHGCSQMWRLIDVGFTSTCCDVRRIPTAHNTVAWTARPAATPPQPCSRTQLTRLNAHEGVQLHTGCRASLTLRSVYPCMVTSRLYGSACAARDVFSSTPPIRVAHTSSSKVRSVVVTPLRAMRGCRPRQRRRRRRHHAIIIVIVHGDNAIVCRAASRP